LPFKANPHLTVAIRGRFGKVMILHNVEYHLIPKVYNWRVRTIYHCVSDNFRVETDDARLKRARQEYGLPDFATLAREFTWERCAQKTLQVFEEVAAS
jgi:hypothetical protein